MAIRKPTHPNNITQRMVTAALANVRQAEPPKAPIAGNETRERAERAPEGIERQPLSGNAGRFFLTVSTLMFLLKELLHNCGATLLLKAK